MSREEHFFGSEDHCLEKMLSVSCPSIFSKGNICQIRYQMQQHAYPALPSF